MKKIILKNPQNSADDLLFMKVDFIGRALFKGFSPIESQIMCELVRIGENGMLNLTIDTAKSIIKALNLNNNTLNVSLGRMEKKGAIRRNKKVIVFMPIFKSILTEDNYLICFKKYDQKQEKTID